MVELVRLIHHRLGRLMHQQNFYVALRTGVGAIYDLPFCATFMAQQGQGKLIFLDEPFTFEPLAWAVRKGDPDFLNWLNNFLRQIKNDGRYDQIYNKWIKSTEWIKLIK
mgnify:CR=1 FL=1